ncbi:acyl-CoA dehydrogenase family protein [Mycobacterium vicinigordonae]|uniref:Acyl-CoA/acyl-ACP dehydrogenase n=1 Tax=Mycobacterium vicinigordonae TaxID=1719132 RepID=A0A7D6E110_9MYCO|nr:acyl-CoA dehydrogenase family protein [Mycobacterium vicinigordonae]QLL05986.1 acyl-CoA/acyl-ACP dehydrogenase [Mycobacterium vicinigordonae]
MNVGLTSEQLALRDTVRGILRTECPPDVPRIALDDLESDPRRWHPLWKTVVDLGWTELAASDSDGEFGPVELALVLEECGAALAPIPLLCSIGLAAGVLRAVVGQHCTDVLGEIASGAVATLAVHSPGARLPGTPMTLRDGRLRGRAVAVPHACHADMIVTLARSSDGPMAVVLRTGDGVTIRPGESTDPLHPFDDVDIDAAPVAAAPIATLDAALAAPLVAAAADLIGVADAALQRSVEHAKTRRQFGAPIGAFQGVKHALADNYVGLERARSLTYAAANRLDEMAAAAWTAAAMAKAAAADAAANCARTAVQVFGALGQTWEHDAHLYVRHAWQGGALLGDSRALYNEVGRRFAGGRA